MITIIIYTNKIIKKLLYLFSIYIYLFIISYNIIK